MELVVDGKLKHKTSTSNGKTALWIESFDLWVFIKTSTWKDIIDSSGSNTLSSSILECQLYVERMFHKDDCIGGTKDEIKLLLAKGVHGDLYIFILILSAN